MIVLVTGCGGFIGSHLTKLLLDEGHYVFGVDNFNDFYSPAVKRHNISFALSNKKFGLIVKNIVDLDIPLLRRYSIDCVVHLAAHPGVLPSLKMPYKYTDNNVHSTLHLLELMKSCSIINGVFASSSSVYGNSKTAKFSETTPVEPISIYGGTKVLLENYCRTYSYAYGLNINCLRFFTCYGPKQRPDLAIYKFTRLLRAGKVISLYGDGTTFRDYTYINDIVQGVYKAIKAVKGFDIINLGSSNPITLSEMVDTLAKSLGIAPKLQYFPIPPGDVTRTFADIARAKRVLNWKPTTVFEDGINSFVKWFNATKSK